MRLDELTEARPSSPRPGREPAGSPAGRSRTRGRARVAAFVGLCLACVSISLVSVASARRRGAEAAPGAPEAVAGSVRAVQGGPHVVFRSTAGATGVLALAPLEAPDRARVGTELSCVRVHMAGGNGLCLTDRGEVFTPYNIVFLGPDLKPRHRESLAGTITRARVSPDGRYGAATVFVTGHSYAPDTFSTQTTLYDMRTGELLADLEHFEVEKDGQRIESPDFNYWGVTFAREPGRFYATLGTAGHTYLVRGDVDSLTMEVLRDGVECPSLSPDGTRLAFKQRVGPGPAVEWRPAVLDLATLEDRPLAESRNVDDQIEWLDDQTVLYAVDAGEGRPSTWSVPADGSGRPSLFMKDADSPAVVRP